jgi:flagellar assembly protein FliH
MQSAWIIEEFTYPEGPGVVEPRWAFAEDFREHGSAPNVETAAPGLAPELSSSDLDNLLREAERSGVAAGREQGRDEGRTEERERERGAQAALTHAMEERRKVERTQLIESFDQARQRYVHDIESEVVRLALAVAARVLRREAQMDPLLLSGAVRVALGQLAASTRVRLKVPGDDLELWREAIALVPNPGVRPEVITGEGMRLGDCVVETELGTVDLGVRAQLNEIEHGFFDRPNAKTTGEATA